MNTIDPRNYPNRTQRRPSGNPRKLYGYPDSWLPAPPKEPDPLEVIRDILIRIEEQLNRIANERLS